MLFGGLQPINSHLTIEIYRKHVKPVAEQRGHEGDGRLGRHLYRGSNFARKCISTIPIGAPIYIWPRAAIPPATPLCETNIKHHLTIEGGGKVLFNDALNTFHLRLYDVGHMANDQSDSERGNSLPPHRLLFPINSKGSFICIIPQTG